MKIVSEAVGTVTSRLFVSVYSQSPKRVQWLWTERSDRCPLLTSEAGPLSAPGQEKVTNSWQRLCTTKQQTAKEKMRVGKPGWAHWLIWAWVPREWALTFGVPQGWIPICAMNQCRAPEFCLAIEAPVLLGSCSFSFFFFPLHWSISKSYLDSLSWNKKTNNHQTQWKWGKCPQWAAWPELDVKAPPEAEES